MLKMKSRNNKVLWYTNGD